AGLRRPLGRDARGGARDPARRVAPRRLCARQGRPGGRSGRHRRRARERGRVMVRVLVAGIIALVISIAAGPKFIDFLRRNEYGQQIREEGPSHHVAKRGTPTMGGLLIVLAAGIAFLPLTFYTLPALTVLFTMGACATIGFIDDFIKLTHRRSLGLAGRWKMLLLGGITVVVGIAAHHQHLSHRVFIPIVDYWLPLSYGWYVLVFLIIAGAANGVNLTDGLDGLAAG